MPSSIPRAAVQNPMAGGFVMNLSTLNNVKLKKVGDAK